MSFARRYAYAIAGAAGAALSVFTYFVTDRVAQRHLETEFFRRADIRHTLTREILNYYEASLFGLRNLYIGSGDVSRAEFDRVATELVSRYPGISALEWAPVVPDAARTAFESAASADYHRSIRITHRVDTDTFISAATKPDYVPVHYVYPLDGRERAIGLDISVGRIATTVARARAERRMIVSEPIDLIERPGQPQSGLIWIWPVAREAGESAPIVGYILGVFRIPEMLDETIRRHPATVLEAIYIDPTLSDPAKQVFHYQGPRQAATRLTEAAFREGFLIREQPLPIGAKVWRVLYRPRPHWADQLESKVPGVLLASGLVLSAVLAAWLRQQSRREALIEHLVADRTAELSESQRKLDAFLHALPGMAYRGVYANEFEVTYISEGSIALTGYRPEEFLSGKIHLRDIINPEDLPNARKSTRSAASAGVEIETSYRIRTRDGTEKWVLSRGRSPGLDAQGRPLFEGLAIDITAQKRAELDRLALERKLLEGQKLESLGLLAGGIAHDFNNLLTGVLGNAGLARLSTPPGASIEPQLRAIEHTALRAAELCRQMLAYAGKGRFVVESVDLTLLVEALLPLLNTSIARRAVLKLEMSRDLPAVMADATQLRQIVMNLVLNAADAMGPDGGVITLRTGSIQADTALLASCAVGADLAPGEFVMLEVIDTGCGMPPEVLARIFDPFFTTKFAGRGLGLAAALGIVRGHGGALHVSSTPGQGSRFQLLLPPTTERGTLPTAIAAPDASWHRAGQVLVIDDEEPVRTVAADMLKTLGLAPRVVSDGSTGVAIFREAPSQYDLVLLDLMMPVMNGEQTLAALRAIRPDVRVLLMSGYSEGDLLRRLAHERSPIGFLPKPFTREALVAQLRALIG